MHDNAAMQSPKFPTKSADLRKIVSASNLRRIWKKKVRENLRRQIVPDAVEHLDFHLSIKQRAFELESSVGAGEYQPQSIIRMRLEKSKGLCRQVVLPSAEDALVLQAVSDALWAIIKNKSPSKNAFYAPQDQAFSKRNSAGGEVEWGYGPIQSWLDFQQTVLKFSRKRRYVVVTDIANYYDFILHSFLRAILSDYAEEREHSLDLLLFVLDSMLWRPDYMPNYGIGMPQMSLDAPRLLAHTHLFEIDEIFSKDPDIDFARYMDDMDFGVDHISKAKTVLRDLDMALQTRNLRLNSGKTKILTSDEARVHFRVRDNQRIDFWEKLVSKASTEKKEKIRRDLPKLLDNRLSEGYFEGGNGDKILKRMLNFLSKVEAQPIDDTFRQILYNKPGLRENLLRLWSISNDPAPQLKIMAGFLRSGEAVDDVSKVHIATYVVNARYEEYVPSSEIEFLVDSYEKQKPFELFCRLWLTSRFRSVTELKAEIDSTNLIWARHPYLVRTIAGFSGLMRNTSHFPSFEAFVRRWGGPQGSALLDFHEAMVSDISVYSGVKPFIDAPNTSLPNKTTHAKALMLASMLGNAAVPKTQRAKLLGNAPLMMSDKYYQAAFSDIISTVR